MLVVLWWLSTVALLVILVVGHLDAGLRTGQTIKSIVGLAKGWAMFAVFITVGACLPIRLQVLSRAANLVGAQTLVLGPLLVAAAYAGLPAEIWVSPLKAVGGPGPEFFAFRLYGVGPDGGLRWSFFAPWAPGAGIAAITIFAVGMFDTDRRWRAAGLCGAVVMVVLVKSRLALLGLPFALGAGLTLCRFDRAWMLAAGSLACLLLGLVWAPLMDMAMDAKSAFEAYRGESTRVRGALQAIARHRAAEAPFWGHAIQDKGTHMVAFMPIGSHHTWNGLLFVKGMAGVVAFAVPMLATTAMLIWRSRTSGAALAGLICLVGTWVYSFGENVEVLIYLFWIGFVAIGSGVGRDTDRAGPGGAHAP